MGTWGTRLRGQTDAIISILIAALTLFVLIATINDHGMVWDEGFTVEREERLREWFHRVVGDDSVSSRAWSPRMSKLQSRSDYLRRAGAEARSPWSRESLRFYWPFAREEPNGHPPFYALLGLAGWSLTHHVIPPPGSYRFGPALLFAVTVGLVYRFMARHYGRLAGLTAAIGLLTMPRVFAHAHFASYDIPTLCLWFLAVSAFLRAIERSEAGQTSWPWVVGFGLAWGCAAATKLPGWLVPVPLFAWVVFHRNGRGLRGLALGGVVAAVVVYCLIPTWWAEPVSGVRTFLESNLTRASLKPIPTIFLGKLYRFALPWYNTLLLTAIVTPPAMLVLALIGIARVLLVRPLDRAGTLVLACWGFFMVLRALPNAPGHDGARQFLTAFVFLACLAGIGLTALDPLFRRIAPRLPTRAFSAAVAVLVIASGAWSTWRFHPLQLSYYNVLIGGLSGAARAGLEPTYYWDSVTPEARAWLNANSAPGDTMGFAFPAVTFEYLHRWGLLTAAPLTGQSQGPPPRWFVVMNRPGHLRFLPSSLGQFLLDHSQPAYVVAVESAPDVPLLAVYSGEEAFAANLILKRPRNSETRPDR